MLSFAAWSLFILGFAHIVFGIIRFKAPVREAIAEGFVGKFAASDTRRLAFWFVILGPMVAFAGQVALHAIAIGDFTLIRMVGLYLLGTSVVGILAFPKSPLWILVLLAPIFIAAGYGWIAP
jgi:hypothetical protein